MESVQVPLIYQTTTSCGVFILTETEILTTSRKDSSEAAYLSRFILLHIHGLLAYTLLRATLQTYSSVFISPSSSESFSDEDENGAARKQQRQTNSQKKATKCNVANLLGMDGRVTPRSVAYAAVLVC